MQSVQGSAQNSINRGEYRVNVNKNRKRISIYLSLEGAPYKFASNEIHFHTFCTSQGPLGVVSEIVLLIPYFLGETLSEALGPCDNSTLERPEGGLLGAGLLGAELLGAELPGVPLA